MSILKMREELGKLLMMMASLIQMTYLLQELMVDIISLEDSQGLESQVKM